MKEVLTFLISLIAFFAAQFMGAGFFWLLRGKYTSFEFWSEFEKGLLFRNELVGGLIIAFIFSIFLEITGNINLI